VKRVAKEWEIWNKKEKTTKLKGKKAKKLVLLRFHKWIHVFRKKTSERMPMKKV